VAREHQIPNPLRERIRGYLVSLYGREAGDTAACQLQRTLETFLQRNTPSPSKDELRDGWLCERDAVLITYGDQITEPDTAPLKSLGEFLAENMGGVLSGVHILPFFPYSSDDGFSVIDYVRVDPDLGTWDDIERLGRTFRLMFDAVINHISAHSDWFQRFLQGDAAYADHFIVVEPGTDLSLVTRPRALPLLTTVDTPSGQKLVWTTFSTDQIDLNFANPEVLLDIIDVLLLYVEKGADIIRLDAIAYLWKEIGTPCIHRPQTHQVVQLMRAVLDAVAPHVLLITETNVPHEENVSYFGDGTNEAQLVYQFPLAPLVLNAFHSGDARHLHRWAAGLAPPSQTTTFFNFTASHDGIGVRPAEGILDAAEFQQLVDKTQKHGGFVSFKTNPDGSQSPYELNISFFDALSDPSLMDEEGAQMQVDRFLASQAIMLSLAGVPGIYVHSLLGSRSFRAGVEASGRYRSINREKFRRLALEAELKDPGSLRHNVFQRYTHLLRVRASQPAFHPNGPQRLLVTEPPLFAMLRTSPDGLERVLCIHNVSAAQHKLRLDLTPLRLSHGDVLDDLVDGGRHEVGAGDELALSIAPYQVLWLKG
jgi:sucrose phosphorylase